VSLTLTNAIARIRVLLRDPVTRPDSTSITPFWSDAEITSALNAAVTNRIPFVERLFDEFYKNTKDYVGITDAIAATSNEKYKLPGCESDSSPLLRHWIEMRRTDLETRPLVLKVRAEHQEAFTLKLVGLFDGLYAAYPENLAPGAETCSIISGSRFRIKPAPASTDYTYRLWYKRYPTAVSSGSDVLDGPDVLLEVYCHDAAIELKQIVNAQSVTVLQNKLDAIIQQLFGEGSQDQAPAIIGTPRM